MRDLKAETVHAEWRGWKEAQNYTWDDDSYQAEAFAAGYEAAQAALRAPGQASAGQACHAGYMENDTANLLTGEDVAARIWAGMGHERTRWENAALRAHAVLAAREPDAAPVVTVEALTTALKGIGTVTVDGCRVDYQENAYGVLAFPEEVARMIAFALPEPQPAPGLAGAPELREAMAETRQLRDLLDDFTHAVIDLRQSVRLADAATAVRKKAGLPPVEGK